jgi:glutaredoxin-related protein
MNSSFCSSCSLAGEIISIDKSFLFAGSALFSMLIIILELLSKDNKKYFKLASMIVASAFIFETVMILNMYHLTGEICKICLIVYLLILMMLISFGYSKKLPVAIFLAIFTALSLFSPNISTSTDKPAFIVNGPTLFYSSSCPHCKETIEYFNHNKIKYTAVNISTPGAQKFLETLNIKSVPVFINNSDKKFLLLNGSEDIIANFNKNEAPIVTVVLPSSIDEIILSRKKINKTFEINHSEPGVEFEKSSDTSECTFASKCNYGEQSIDNKR